MSFNPLGGIGRPLQRLIALTVRIGVIVSLACNGAPDSRQFPGSSVRDSGGVILVSNSLDSIPHGCVNVLPQPVVTIPPAVQDRVSNPFLQQVRGGVILTDGRIVVLNGGTRELLFWGADGQYRSAVGGRGRGPGEFVNPTWLGHSADTLFVWDTGQMRLSAFDGTGAILTSHQMQADDGADVPQSVGGRFADGSFFVRPGPFVFFGSQTGVVRFAQTYGRYDVENRHLQRLVNGKGPETVVGDGAIYELPFGKTYLAIAHGNGIVAGDNGASALRYYDTDGQLVRVMEWVTTPIKVTARDEDAFHEHAARVFPAFARPPRTARFAQERPRFSAIQSDQNGWIWVRLFAAEWESHADWLIFDESGMLRCSVEIPTREVLDIGEGQLLGLHRSELGEETVQVFTIIRAVP